MNKRQFIKFQIALLYFTSRMIQFPQKLSVKQTYLILREWVSRMYKNINRTKWNYILKCR